MHAQSIEILCHICAVKGTNGDNKKEEDRNLKEIQQGTIKVQQLRNASVGCVATVLLYYLTAFFPHSSFDFQE